MAPVDQDLDEESDPALADPDFQAYSDSKNPFHTNLNGGAHSAPPNAVGIALSLGGVKNRKYSWLQDRPLGHVIWFTHRWDMANPKQ